MASGTMLFDAEARDRLLRGAGLVADLVAPTLGPSSRTVLVGRTFGPPVITDGGHELALAVELGAGPEQLGVQAMRQLAVATHDAHGDGTATAVVLAGRMLRGVVTAAAAGLDPAALTAQLSVMAEAANASLRQRRSRIADEAAVAAIARAAAGGDAEIGRIVGQAWWRVGTEGSVIVEKAQGTEDEVEVRDGMHLPQGWLSSGFVTDGRSQSVEFEDAFVLVAAQAITDLGAIVPALNAFASSGKPLVIIAEDVAGEALATLIANRRRADVKVVAVKAPGAGTWKRLLLGDVAVATGATLIGDEQGYRLDDLGPAMVGRARRVVVTRQSTLLAGGAGKPADIAARCREIRGAIDGARYLAFDREQHQLRLARLTAAVATLRFGAVSESALAVRHGLATAASGAARAALRDGTLPGGGVAYLEATRSLPSGGKDDLAARTARRILAGALTAPFETIAGNRGRDGRALAARALAEATGPVAGYDAVADRVCDVEEAGILDAAPILETALRNAVSTTSRLGGAGAAWSADGQSG